MTINLLHADDELKYRIDFKKSVESNKSHINIKYSLEDGFEVNNKRKGFEGVDIYVLDLEMPLFNGLETALSLLKENSEAKIIIYSRNINKDLIPVYLKKGIKGVFTPYDCIENIVDGIQRVHSGKWFISKSLMEKIK